MFSTATRSAFAFESLPSTTSQKRTAQRGCRSGEYPAGAGKVRLGASMKLSVIYQLTLPASNSPYRVCNEDGGEIEWANAFLDSQRLRQLSLRSLRIYSYDLLNFARWFGPQHRLLAAITESTIVDY